MNAVYGANFNASLILDVNARGGDDVAIAALPGRPYRGE
jgi:hypothetical protein